MSWVRDIPPPARGIDATEILMIGIIGPGDRTPARDAKGASRLSARRFVTLAASRRWK